MGIYLLSIKPKYAEKIKSGEKTVEIRKVFYANPGDQIWIYESKPVQKITARFNVEKVYHEVPETLWNLTKDQNGLTKEEFDSYCKKSHCHAGIVIKDLEVFNKPIDPYTELSNFHPPQNYKIWSR